MLKRIIVGVLLALLAVTTLLAVAPILGVIFTGVVASTLHCQVDEGSVHACFYSGRDIGPLLYQLGVLGWLMIVTIPILFIALPIWVGVGYVFITRRRQ